MTTSTWQPLEVDPHNPKPQSESPLDALSAGDIPAIVLRGAYPLERCQELFDKLVAEEWLYDPAKPVPEKFLEASIPEGYYREGKQGTEKRAWEEKLSSGKRRIDIGTSLGYRGSDPADFFSHAQGTRELFAQLFVDLPSPIEVMYSHLQDLSCGKLAKTAYEPDGRTYGPAIIRAHYGGYTYRPHFDSVRLREKREDYSVSRFENQFAGVLVLKNSERDGATAQCTLHRYLWQPEVQPYLDTGTFAEFAKERNIDNVQVVLEPGDLYFFNTRCIHEVPGIDGTEPRVVVATFIGYSEDEPEIFVWS